MVTPMARLAGGFLAILTVATALPQAYQQDDDNGLIVQTSSGEVHGFINQTTPDVRQWLGVPYAEPPLGYLRFAAPLPKSREQDPIHASAWKPSCMQTWSNSSTVYTEVVPQFLIDGGSSEDCLYVNIWAPAAENVRGKENVPVFVYIPGGGFTSGGAHSWYKVPDQLIQARQDAVFVIMNYRVNVFGFPNADGLDGKNPGLLDQRMVVEWTRDNIAGFGGDPERITLWGQSAGGGSVDMYSYAWHQDPIVTGLAADSGSANNRFDPQNGAGNFSFLASKVGCRGLKASAELTCMQNVPAGTLENVLSSYQASDEEPSISFTPVVDGVLTFENYTQRASDGQIAQRPMIIGNNANEGAGFVDFSLEGPGSEALAAQTTRLACGVTASVDNRLLAGLPTYRYQYAGNFSNISPLPWMGAYHSSELPMVFGTHWEYRGNSTEYEWNVATVMQDLWLSFAADASRGPSAEMADGNTFSWQKFASGGTTLAHFAANGSIVESVDAAFIDDLCSSRGGPNPLVQRLG